ncbi:MAG TPA: ABC transporter permease [Burkholderiales bacterium]|nr:ABC transporter permease [Burkholderiales bacterium]
MRERLGSSMMGLFGRRSMTALGSLLISFAVLVLIWQLAASAAHLDLLLPSPFTVARAAVAMVASGELQSDIAASMARIVTGYFIGAAIAIPTGLLMGTVPFIRRFVDPYIEFFRYIPALSLITMALIWFGIGESSKVFLIVYGTTFIVVVATSAGVAAIPKNRLRAAASLGANRPQMFVLVVLPSVIPQIYTGMRIALGNAFTTIVAAELVSAQSGLGYVIFNARLYLQTDKIFVAIIALGLLGLASDRLLRTVFRWLGWRFVQGAAASE